MQKGLPVIIIITYYDAKAATGIVCCFNESTSVSRLFANMFEEYNNIIVAYKWGDAIRSNMVWHANTRRIYLCTCWRLIKFCFSYFGWLAWNPLISFLIHIERIERSHEEIQQFSLWPWPIRSTGSENHLSFVVTRPCISTSWIEFNISILLPLECVCITSDQRNETLDASSTFACIFDVHSDTIRVSSHRISFRNTKPK